MCWKFYVTFCVNLTEFIWKKRNTPEFLSPSKKGPRNWRDNACPRISLRPFSRQGISNLSVKKFEAAQARGFPRSFPFFGLGFSKLVPLNKNQFFFFGVIFFVFFWVSGTWRKEFLLGKGTFIDFSVSCFHLWAEFMDFFPPPRVHDESSHGRHLRYNNGNGKWFVLGKWKMENNNGKWKVFC